MPPKEISRWVAAALLCAFVAPGPQLQEVRNLGLETACKVSQVYRKTANWAADVQWRIRLIRQLAGGIEAEAACESEEPATDSSKSGATD